nr:VanZ family protein [uncultured Bacillus sp.]
MRRKRWMLAVLAWMLIIFLATQLPYFTGQNTSKVIRQVVTVKQQVTHISGSSVNVSDLNLIVRKATHVIVFGILAVLLFKAFGGRRFSYVLAWVCTFLYAVTDEWHQSFVSGRVASFRDVLFDAFGALAALGMVCFVRRTRRLRTRATK